jgi:hypothetical protein
LRADVSGPVVGVHISQSGAQSNNCDSKPLHRRVLSRKSRAVNCLQVSIRRN